MATLTTLTPEDLLDLPAPVNGKHYELNEGELIVVGNAHPLHERVKARICRILGRYVDGNPIGEVLPESQFTLSPRTARIPDVAFVSNELLDRNTNPKLFEFAPDIAVEVVSPSESGTDTELKVQQYLAAGSREVWQIYAELRLVRVRTPAATRDVSGDEILESPVLPGFRTPAAAFFGSK